MNDLQERLKATYVALRFGPAIIGAVFPLILLMVDPTKGSISAHYWSPMRDLFVGVLFALGLIMILNKGLTTKEEWALNVAGTAAIVVALFPTDFKEKVGEIDEVVTKCCEVLGMNLDWAGAMHFACATLLFLCIVFICLVETKSIFERKKILFSKLSIQSVPIRLFGLHRSPATDEFFKFLRKVYLAIGAAMLITLGALVSARILMPGWTTLLFWGESWMIWFFASYWLVKGVEVKFTDEYSIVASP